jgi:hypothetical protein
VRVGSGLASAKLSTSAFRVCQPALRTCGRGLYAIRAPALSLLYHTARRSGRRGRGSHGHSKTSGPARPFCYHHRPGPGARSWSVVAAPRPFRRALHGGSRLAWGFPLGRGTVCAVRPGLFATLRAPVGSPKTAPTACPATQRDESTPGYSPRGTHLPLVWGLRSSPPLGGGGGGAPTGRARRRFRSSC